MLGYEQVSASQVVTIFMIVIFFPIVRKSEVERKVLPSRSLFPFALICKKEKSNVGFLFAYVHIQDS